MANSDRLNTIHGRLLRLQGQGKQSPSPLQSFLGNMRVQRFFIICGEYAVLAVFFNLLLKFIGGEVLLSLHGTDPYYTRVVIFTNVLFICFRMLTLSIVLISGVQEVRRAW